MTSACDRFEPLLSPFIDGDLDDGVAAEVREHLLGCAACTAVERDLRRIADAAGTLPPLEPPADQWARLAARLDVAAAGDAAGAEPSPGPRRLGRRERLAATFDPGSGRGRRAWLLPAALGAAAAAAALLVTLRPTRSPVVPPTATRVPEGLVLVGGPPDELSLRERERMSDAVVLADAQREFDLAEQHFARAADRLAGLVARERADRPFSPALRVAFDRNLKVIDAAIAQCRTLARGAPDDPWRHEVLFAAYRRKIRFLEEVLQDRVREEVTP
jgi:hypothetical protein